MANSRIKRRNKSGFAGLGTPKWIKKSNYGDYSLDRYNHKSDTQDVYYQNLVNRAKNANKHHPGSKSIHTLKQYIHGC